MGIMRERLRSFMQGRYGVDALSKVLLGVAFVCAVLSLFFGKLFYLIGLCLLAYIYFRMFSRNYERRYRENRAFLDKTNRIAAFFRAQKSLMQQRKTHHIYKCAQCGQKIRIPKGRGKVIVTCPKCRFQFQKKS